MLDLETLGTVPGAVILSVGAVVFDPLSGTLGDEFYTVVSKADAKENFMSVDADTVKWWNDQSEEARAVIRMAEHPDAPTIAEVCQSLNYWMRALNVGSRIRLYGNGADFDNPLLRVMYACAKVEPYAKGYGGRCYRTLKNLDELMGADFAFHKLERTGTHHNALDDAKSQATHLMANLARIRGVLNTGARTENTDV
jgi:hypothetical protein